MALIRKKLVVENVMIKKQVSLIVLLSLLGCSSVKPQETAKRCPAFYILSGSSKLPLSKQSLALEEIYCSTQDAPQGSYELYLKLKTPQKDLSKLSSVKYNIGVIDKNNEPIFLETVTKELTPKEFIASHHRIIITPKKGLPQDAKIVVGFDLSEQDALELEKEQKSLEKEQKSLENLMGEHAKAYDFKRAKKE
ncbi:MAG TPA: hypothetical protein VI959_03220 [Alphaproteobacteria bacterium]|nr:hypothetical protein [Alphaproteobacteria bacterium]